MKLNPYLRDFWKTHKQIKVLYGGRASSKSYDTAGVLLFFASKVKLRILCARRFQNKISESVYALLKTIIMEDEIYRKRFKIYENSIKCDNGSEFIFLGIQRNISEIKGLSNISITWIEESELLTEEQWNIIRPTILREQGSFCIMVFNPRFDTDFVYKEFILKKHSNVLTRKINYTDNPFLSEDALNLIHVDKEELDSNVFNNIYLGNPKSENEDALIKRKWLYACIDAHKKLETDTSNQRFIGYDVADSGVDKNAVVIRQGCTVNLVDEWNAEEDELFKSTKKVHNLAIENFATVIYDSIGVGAGVGSMIDQLNKQTGARVQHNKFNAGAKVDNPEEYYQHNVKNKEFYSNLKAQAWWKIAERIKATYNAIENKAEINPEDVISIDSAIEGIDELIVELSTPMKDFDNNGKVKVESKKDLSKRDVASPNKADAFIMCYYNNHINYSNLL